MRIGLGFEWSQASDYSSPLRPPVNILDELSGDLEVEWRLIEAHTTAVTVELSTYTTIHYAIVFNPATQNDGTASPDVCAALTPVGGHVGSPASSPHDIGPGKIAVFPDVNPANNITLDSESGTTNRVWVGIIGT